MQYHHLQLKRNGESLIAVVPISKLQPDFDSRIGEDFDKLAQEHCSGIIVDLRQVDFANGSFISILVLLHKRCQKKSVPVGLAVSQVIRNIIQVLNLHLIFWVLDDGEDPMTV